MKGFSRLFFIILLSAGQLSVLNAQTIKQKINSLQYAPIIPQPEPEPEPQPEPENEPESDSKA